MGRTIRTKMILSLIPAIIIILIVATLFSLQFSSAAQKDATYEENLHSARAYAHEFNTQMSHDFTISRTFSSVLNHETGMTRESVLDIQHTLLNDTPRAIGIGVIFEPDTFDGEDARYAGSPGHDPTGRFAAYWNRLNGSESLIPIVDIGTSDWYTIPKETGKAVVMEPLLYEGVLMTSYITPIIRNQTFSGTVGVDVALDSLDQTVSRIQAFQSGYAFLVSNGGIFVSAPKKGYIGRTSLRDLSLETNNPDLTRMAEEISRGNEGYIETTDPFTGKPAVMFYSPIQTGNWSMVMVVPTGEMLAGVTYLGSIMLLIGILSILLISGIVFIVARNFSQPVVSMSNMANQIASGDLDVRVPAQDGELGVLADALNNMASRLSGMIGRLEEKVTELQDIRQALQGSEERLRLSLDAANDGIWDWDVPSGCAIFSDRWFGMLGYGSDELPSSYNTWVSLLHPADRQWVPGTISSHILTSDEPFTEEFRMQTKEGEWVWIFARGKVVQRDQEGVPVRIVGTHTDISNLKRVQEELAEKHEELISSYQELSANQENLLLKDIFFNSSVTSNSYADLNGIILQVNAAFLKMWGLSDPEQAIGKSIADFFAEQNEAAVIVETLNTSGEWIGEFTALRPDGGTFISRGDAIRVTDRNGIPIGYYASNVDVTAQRTLEREHEILIADLNQRNEQLHEVNENLRLSEEELQHQYASLKTTEEHLRQTTDYLENLIAYANVPIIVWGPDFIITRVNHAFENLSGRDSGEVVGKSIDILFPPERVGHSLRLLETTRAGVRWDTVELAILHQNGSVRTVLWNSSTLYAPDGFTPVATFAQGQDVTLQRNLERQNAESVIQIQKNIAQLSILNDQIRNPLTIMLSSAEMVEDSSVATVITEQTRRIDEMVTQLDLRWVESEKILSMLRRNYQIYASPSADRISRDHDARMATIRNSEKHDSSSQSSQTLLIAELEAELYTILDSIDALIYVADLDTYDILYLNRMGRNRFGDVAGKKCYLAIHGFEDGPCPFCTNPLLTDKFGSTGVQTSEYQNTRSGRWYDCRDRAIRWSDGRLVHLQVATDITERKTVDESIRDNEYTFRKLFEESSDPILLMQGDQFLECNQATLDLLGISEKAQFIGTTPVAISPEYQPDGRRSDEGVDEYIARARQDGHCRFEWMCLRADGTPVLLEVSLLQILFRGEEMLHVTWRDITGRKQAEQALIRVNETLSRQTKTLSILNKIINTANGAKNTTRLLQDVLDQTLDLLDFDAGGIYLLDSVQEVATVVYSKNLSPDFLAEIRTIPVHKPPYDNLLIRGIPVITDHYEQVSPERARKTGFCSIVSIPVYSKDQIFGALNAISKQRHVVSEDEVQTLLSIGRELGTIIERIHAEEESHHLASNLETLFNSVDEMVFVLDVDGTILRVNETVMKRLLYTPEEIKGRNILFLYPSELSDEVSGYIMGILAGKTEICSSPVIAKDGTLIEADTKISKGIWDNREVLIAVTRDVTGHRNAERALMANEARLAHALEGAGEGLWEWHIPSGTSYFSPRYYTMLGYEPGEFPSTFEAWSALIHPDEQERVVSQLLEQLKTRKSGLEIEYRARSKEGEWRWILGRGKANEWDEEGNIVRLIGTNSDITIRKEAEEALRESEERYRTLTEQSSDVIMLFDRDLRHRYVNPAVYGVLGIRAEEFIGKTHKEMGFPENLVQIWEEALNKTLERGISDYVVFQLPDGTWINWYLMPLHDQAGEIEGVLTSARDITELKEAEQVIRQANQQISLLTSITRHDINNKITAILTTLNVAESEYSDPVLNSYLGIIKSATNDIKAQIAFTQIYQDLGTHKPQWQFLTDIILRLPVPENISLSVDVAGIELYADPMLEKVFFNLLDNSIRHGGQVTEIRVSSSRSGIDLVIIWEDNGTGISGDEKVRIFERGYGKNSGLGLFMVREVLFLTGMEITETGAEGSGARFEIRVPQGGYRL